MIFCLFCANLLDYLFNIYYFSQLIFFLLFPFICESSSSFFVILFHFIFYAFVGYYVDAKKVIYDLLKKEQSSKRCDNGAIIVIDIDNIIDNSSDKNTDNIKIIEKELNQILGEKNKVIIINRKKEIAKIIIITNLS